MTNCRSYVEDISSFLEETSPKEVLAYAFKEMQAMEKPIKGATSFRMSKTRKCLIYAPISYL